MIDELRGTIWTVTRSLDQLRRELFGTGFTLSLCLALGFPHSAKSNSRTQDF
jgi:hypothetical protein